MVLLLLGCVFFSLIWVFFFFVSVDLRWLVWQHIWAGCLVRLVTSHVRWFYLPPMTPILVAVCLAFRVKRKSPCMGTVFRGWGREVQLQEFYSWPFGKPVWKTGVWKNKNDVYEKCLIHVCHQIIFKISRTVYIKHWKMPGNSVPRLLCDSRDGQKDFCSCLWNIFISKIKLLENVLFWGVGSECSRWKFLLISKM